MYTFSLAPHQNLKPWAAQTEYRWNFNVCDVPLEHKRFPEAWAKTLLGIPSMFVFYGLVQTGSCHFDIRFYVSYKVNSLGC